MCKLSLLVCLILSFPFFKSDITKDGSWYANYGNEYSDDEFFVKIF